MAETAKTKKKGRSRQAPKGGRAAKKDRGGGNIRLCREEIDRMLSGSGSELALKYADEIILKRENTL